MSRNSRGARPGRRAVTRLLQCTLREYDSLSPELLLPSHQPALHRGFVREIMHSGDRHTALDIRAGYSRMLTMLRLLGSGQQDISRLRFDVPIQLPRGGQL
jgi:hypothetical protein